MSEKLIAAIEAHDASAVDDLLASSGRAMSADDMRDALVAGVLFGTPALVGKLLSAGADPNAVDDDGWNAHMFARLVGDRTVAGMLAGLNV
ncbi:hypothetical protein IP88_07550 [alpha proteobacterium AAP81b]|nr:hypothetical protein IP88_07550 [alpha proteobacterium AAP81b]